MDFRDHRRELDANLYVYAVLSRRARGLSIGVNLNTDKVCNFDCPYCQVDRTRPGGPRDVDLARLGAELDALLEEVEAGRIWQRAPFDSVDAALRRVADIAFSGDGEPTSPPEFPEAARIARDERERHGLSVPLRLITNATLLDRQRVRSALPLFDELWCKLDAGTAEFFRLAAGTRLPFERVLANLTSVARERPIVIQSLFMAVDGVGPVPAEIEAYLGRLSEILAAGGQIDRVQVYTVARKPADPRVGPLPVEALTAIAERVRALGLAAEVHG
jgi:wyosine [tRNA(Phe)-imidazoG37] synthetase (radical SAM superfamily)